MNNLFQILILTIFAQTATAQSAHNSLRSGDADYLAGKYPKAEENYRRSLDAAASSKGHFNLGNAIFQQKKYADAIKQYEQSSITAPSNELKSNALYNKGNAHFWKGDYEKAIESYKQALRANPSDEDAKRNLALTKKYLEQQKKEQQRQQEEQKNQGKDPQKDKSKDEQKNQQNKQNQASPPKTDDKKQAPPPPNAPQQPSKTDDKTSRNHKMLTKTLNIIHSKRNKI